MGTQGSWTTLMGRLVQAVRHLSLSPLLLAGTLGLVAPGLADAPPTTTWVSVGLGGIEGDGPAWNPAISADGRWVAFASAASNLVEGDTNGRFDVFVYDREMGPTARVSVGPGGTQGNGESRGAAISADGRWVAFHSSASNLVSNDTNGVFDVFVHDRDTRTTTRVSVATGGVQGNGRSYSILGSPAISADGRWVAFDSYASNLVAGDTNGFRDTFVHDRQTGTTTRVSVSTDGAEGNDSSYDPAISADGRWVAFPSAASNLVADDTNRILDVFVHDRQAGTTTRVSVSSWGDQGNDLSGFPAISADGRWVPFLSLARNLVLGDTDFFLEDVYLHDRGDAGCPVTLVPTSASSPAGGTRGTVMVLTSVACPWTALSNDPSWLMVTDGASGTGYGTVGYEVTANTARARAGTISIGGETFTLSQAAAPTPTTVPDTYATAFNTPLNVVAPGVLGNDTSNGAGALTAVLVGAPPRGSVSLDASGAFTYTPAAGFRGVDTFTYRAVAIGGSPGNVASVSITVADATPLPPTGLVAHAAVGDVVTLRWTIPPIGPVPTNFVLEGGVSPGEVLASIPTGSTAPTFTFEAPTGSFYARLHAVNGTVRSAASNEIRLHVNVPVAPSAPAHLLGLVNGSNLALAWTNTYAGGAPTSLVLDVTGSIVISLPLGFGDSFSFVGVPPGTYTLALRALNAAGSSPPSSAVTLTFPDACTGPPWVPRTVLAYRVGNTVYVDWAPATGGPAPTSYVVNVTGAWVGSLPTTGRALSGTVAPGSYTLSVVAVNWCGASAGSPPQTVVVP
ncbi:MAG: Ig-like domain-containing protein [Acidobacteriota bacterium]|nr:Ig-like domain-containing protein [Acidobacteriota bacterium]